MSADRPSHQCNDGIVTCALRGFLFVPDVLYSFDPPLHRSRSRAPPSGRVYCPFVFSRLSVVSLSSFFWHFHFSVCFRFVCCRPSSPFTNVKPHSSHITLGHLQRHCYLEQQQFHRSLLPHLLSVYLPRFKRGFTVGLQPSRVTGLQATSPERSPPSAPRPFV